MRRARIPSWHSISSSSKSRDSWRAQSSGNLVPEHGGDSVPRTVSTVNQRFPTGKITPAPEDNTVNLWQTRDPLQHPPGPLAPSQDSPLAGADHESQAMQIIAGILRDIEGRRLPEVLAVRDAIAGGEPISEEDEACLSDLIAVLEQALCLWPEHEQLRKAREAASQLCDSILTRAYASRSGAQPGHQLSLP